MRNLIARMFGVGSPLSPLERLVLGNIRERLSAPIQIVWDKQIAAINKVQRLPEGAEANFYRMKNGCPSFDGDIAFPNRSTELLIAKIHLEAPNNISLVADVWSVNGFIFSIEYGNKVDYFEEAVDMDPPLPFILNCALVADLMADVS